MAAPRATSGILTSKPAKSDSAGGPIYWKVLKHDHNHHGHIWVNGHNVLKGQFKSSTKEYGGPGRLSYTEQQYLSRWIEFGDHIQRIYEPQKDTKFLKVSFPDMEGANHVILDDEVWSLRHVKTYIMLTSHPKYVHAAQVRDWIPYAASRLGAIAVLEWYCSSPVYKQQPTSTYVMDIASKHGHIHVLEWWKRHHEQQRVAYRIADASGASADASSASGAASVTDLYSCASIDEASARGDIAVLQWWLNSKLPLVYTCSAIDDASANGQDGCSSIPGGRWREHRTRISCTFWTGGEQVHSSALRLHHSHKQCH
jgi:hypothetical protein